MGSVWSAANDEFVVLVSYEQVTLLNFPRSSPRIEVMAACLQRWCDPDGRSAWATQRGPASIVVRRYVAPRTIPRPCLARGVAVTAYASAPRSASHQGVTKKRGKSFAFPSARDGFRLCSLPKTCEPDVVITWSGGSPILSRAQRTRAEPRPSICCARNWRRCRWPSNQGGLESAKPDVQSRFKKPGGVRPDLRLWGTLHDERAEQG